MQKQLQFYPRVERNCIEFIKCGWFLTPKFHDSVWGEDLSPELCIIRDPQSQAFASRLHFSWRQDETWCQRRIGDKTRGTGGMQTVQIDINFFKFRLEEICTVCRPMAAAVLWQSRVSLWVQKRGNSGIRHSQFFTVCTLFVHVCITCTACTMCQIHKVENLPKIVVAFFDPKSHRQLWTFPWIFTQEVNDSKISTFLAYFSKESSWSHGCSSWMKYHMTSQTYSSPCFFSAVYCSIARAARRWELDPETS